MFKQMPINYYKIYMNIIENGTTIEFLQFAKSYNIFQESGTKIYETICNKIKQRLDKEGLSHEVVRPE